MKDLTARQALMTLNALPELGPLVVNQLLAACGGDACAALALGAKAESGLRHRARQALAEWPRRFDPAGEEERLAALSAGFLVATDSEYPLLLREIPDPPPGLYRRGTFRPGAVNVGVVGTRRTTAYGEATARRIAAGLVRAGCCVVSGLARGIDTAAHLGALEAGGATVAVLGTGVDVVYPPENRGLVAQIAERGALLSEYPLGREPDKLGFVRRNRIISGICPVVVVVESDIDGGAMLTAGFAAEQNRTVCAVPGRIDLPSSAGCHRLIRDGAVLVTGFEEILEELKLPAPLRFARPPGAPPGEGADSASDRAPDEAAVLKELGDGALVSLDTLAVRTGLPAVRLAPALVMLELDGRIARRPDGRYEILIRPG